MAAAAGAGFDLKDGDRVVLLGNSLFENELPYGYLVFALPTRWPSRNHATAGRQGYTRSDQAGNGTVD